MHIKHIGDGKHPNHYWVFHYNEKFYYDEGDLTVTTDSDSEEKKDSLLGDYKTYREAMNCRNTMAFYPHVVIEDRLSGMIYEDTVIVCRCCGHERYESNEDISFTKKKMEEAGYIFE